MYINIKTFRKFEAYVFIRDKDRDFCTHFIIMRNILITIYFLVSHQIGAVDYGAVVFSELMVDPEPTVGLPPVEYLELYNRSATAVSLTGWTLLYGDKSYSLPACSLDPGAYVVLCAKANVIAFSEAAMGMSTFPSLLNTGKLMALLSSSAELVSCLDYSEKWYGSGFKAEGGWSMECKDLSNLSGSANNWMASKDASGGTPGRMNSVATVNPSSTIPHCTRLYVPSPNTLEVHFSEFMQPSDLTNILNYSITPESAIILSATIDLPELRRVKLTLSDTLVSGVTYGLSLTGLYNISDIPLKDTILQVGLPEIPEPGSLQLNELLFNPKSGGFDYVEFVNVSSKGVDLSQVLLTNRSADGTLNAGKQLSDKPLCCLPGTYWLLTENPDSLCLTFPTMPNAIQLAGFPSMPDDLGNVSLVTTSAEIVDEVDYDEHMHFALITNREGVALEKIRPEAPSHQRSNWLSANAASHFGTPGFKNSQFREAEVPSSKGFYVRQAWMTPNNDGQDDRVDILYELPEPCAGNLTLYDLNGRVIRKLVNNEVLATSGSILWDGIRQDGTPAPIGRYILFAEAYTQTGKVIRNRLVLTILF